MKPSALLVIVLVVLGFACGEDDPSDPTDCPDDTVAVTYLGGDRDEEVNCVAIPSECGAQADCAEQACISAMYGLCESPYIGVGCSDTFPPTIISCNP